MCLDDYRRTGWAGIIALYVYARKGDLSKTLEPIWRIHTITDMSQLYNIYIYIMGNSRFLLALYTEKL